MIRLLLILIVAGLIAAGAAWVADNDGMATFVMAGYETRMSASVALVLMLVLAGIIALLFRVAFFLLGATVKLGPWATQRRARHFYQALSHGLIAAASGDAQEAAHFARRSEKLLRRQPLSFLLKAQASQLAGDDANEEEAYRAMLAFPETEFLGLRGLYLLAMRHHDDTQALIHATRAYALKPKAWAMDALFDLRVSHREWREALALVIQAARAKALTPDIARRRRAVLLAAQAVEAERAGDAAAQAYALEALALAPSLTAAALIAARHLTEQGRIWKAQDVIEAAWAQAPHRDLAEAYAAIRPEDDREARANRLMGLAKLNPAHRDSRVLMAEQQIALRQYDEARETLEPLAEDYSSTRVCNLMAAIAQAQDNILTAQLWRSRAARAGRVAEWRCVKCSKAAPEWGPLCQHCGAFDTLNWTAPGALTLDHGPRPVDIAKPLVEINVEPSGAIVDVSSRSRTARSEDISGFLRAPDDPGPGGHMDIFDTGESAEPVEEDAPEPANRAQG